MGPFQGFYMVPAQNWDFWRGPRLFWPIKWHEWQPFWGHKSWGPLWKSRFIYNSSLFNFNKGSVGCDWNKFEEGYSLGAANLPVLNVKLLSASRWRSSRLLWHQPTSFFTHLKLQLLQKNPVWNGQVPFSVCVNLLQVGNTKKLN